MRKPTNIERLLIDYLNKLNLKFRREYKVENYHVDIYLPLYKLSIQVDGNYHHGVCNKCKKELKKRMHRSVLCQKERDKACVMFHKVHGISIIRLCECEINDFEFVKNEIAKAIEHILNGYLYIRTREL